MNLTKAAISVGSIVIIFFYLSQFITRTSYLLTFIISLALLSLIIIIFLKDRKLRLSPDYHEQVEIVRKLLHEPGEEVESNLKKEGYGPYLRHAKKKIQDEQNLIKKVRTGQKRH